MYYFTPIRLRNVLRKSKFVFHQQSTKLWCVHSQFHKLNDRVTSPRDYFHVHNVQSIDKGLLCNRKWTHPLANWDCSFWSTVWSPMDWESGVAKQQKSAQKKWNFSHFSGWKQTWRQLQLEAPQTLNSIECLHICNAIGGKIVLHTLHIQQPLCLFGFKLPTMPNVDMISQKKISLIDKIAFPHHELDIVTFEYQLIQDSSEPGPFIPRDGPVQMVFYGTVFNNCSTLPFPRLPKWTTIDGTLTKSRWLTRFLTF